MMKGVVKKERASFASLASSNAVSMEWEQYDGLTTGIIDNDEHDDDSSDNIIRRSWFELQRISLLGQGVYSSVYLVVDPETRTQYALKCLDASRIGSSEAFLDAASDLARETSLLTRLDHENVIQIRGVCSTPLSESYQEDGNGFFFLMDVLQETLKDRLDRWRSDRTLYHQKKKKMAAFSFPSIRRLGGGGGGGVDAERMYGRIETVVLGIVRGMRYLHEEQSIVLRDLKPANIGFDANTGQVRLFDFGMSRHLKECVLETQDVVGTPRYMAPEVMLAQGTSFASDVYSFGVLLYEICSLQIAFSKQRSLEDFQKHVVDAQARPNVNVIPCLALRDLIVSCWAHNPKDRPTFAEIQPQLLEILLLRGEEPTAARAPEKKYLRSQQDQVAEKHQHQSSSSATAARLVRNRSSSSLMTRTVRTDQCESFAEEEE